LTKRCNWGCAHLIACDFSAFIDTLTIASMLPRVDAIIHEASSAIARADHVFIGNMS
jgi:hypothetical protein